MFNTKERLFAREQNDPNIHKAGILQLHILFPKHLGIQQDCTLG